MLMLQLKLRKQLRCVIWILYSCVNVTCSYYGCQVFDYWYFSTGHSLPRRRKLCLLGWTWGISVSLEHKYGKRTWSSGNIHFFPKCLAYAFKYDTMNFSFSKIIHFWSILFFFFGFQLIDLVPTGKVYGRSCCLQEEDWIQWYIMSFHNLCLLHIWVMWNFHLVGV